MENNCQLFPICPTSEVFETFTLSIANLLAAPEEIIPRNDKRKIDTLKLLQYLIHSPIDDGPSSSSYMQKLLNELKPTSTLSNSQLVEMSKIVIRGQFNTKLKNDMIAFIVKGLLKNPSRDGSLTLCHIWQTRDTVSLSSNILEEILIGEPLCIETTLLHLAQKVVQSPIEDTLKSILYNANMKQFLHLCSISPKIFQMTVTILHELLLISNINEVMLNFVKMFVGCVDECCDQGFFLNMFPVEQQALVVFLQMDPMLYPERHEDEEFTRSSVLKLLVESLMYKRRITGALLTYYPAWLPILQEYCQCNKVIDLLPSDGEYKNSLKEYWTFILLEY